MENVQIQALDDFPLIGTFFPASTPCKSLKICIIAPATGIAQSFYYDFASYVSSRGISVLTFDYRFNGLSFPNQTIPPTPLSHDAKIAILRRHQDVTLSDFGKLDLPGVFRHVMHHWPECEILYMGHSVGCHVLPLVPTTYLHKLHRVLFISATNPYIGAYRSDAPRRGWEAMVQFVQENGYFDGRQFKFGGLLPAAALRQWRDWATLPLYAAGDPSQSAAYAAFDLSLTSLGFDDDVQVLMSPHTLEAWCDALPRADIRLVRVASEGVGHNDVFRVKNRHPYWDGLHGFLESGHLDLPHSRQIQRQQRTSRI